MYAVTNQTTRGVNEQQYRKGVRILFILLVLYIPVVGAIGFGLDKVLDSELPFGITALVYLAVVVFFSVRAFIAYCKWTGKYPYYWLRK